MKVKYFAYLRKDSGRDEEYVDCPDTVLELLRDLSARHGAALREHLLDGGMGMNADLIVLVNGRNILFLDGTDTKLEDSDTVTLFPRVAGG